MGVFSQICIRIVGCSKESSCTDVLSVMSNLIHRSVFYVHEVNLYLHFGANILGSHCRTVPLWNSSYFLESLTNLKQCTLNFSSMFRTTALSMGVFRSSYNLKADCCASILRNLLSCAITVKTYYGSFRATYKYFPLLIIPSCICLHTKMNACW